MQHPLSLLALVVAAIIALWSWLGAGVPMPPSPLAAGEKLYCVSYAPFRGRQSPLDPNIRIEAWQIEDDIVRLAALTDCVRTYSTRNGLDQVAGIAERHGVKVIQGIWLGGERAAMERDIATAIDVAKRHPQTVRSVVVGNEVLLRGEMSASDLAATITRVKSQVTQPVTYADVWEFWLRYREVYAAVDFVTIHILPYWEDFPIPARRAAAHVEAIRRKLVEAFPSKEVLIGETGWPSAGRMRDAALPSPANQARVMHDILRIARDQGYHVNLIEAFDQPWKRRLEGTVGGHWGLLDAVKRVPKFIWGRPVSNHPGWRLQAAEGVALAILVFVAAFSARPASMPPPSRRAWIGVAAMAFGAGGLIGWTVEELPVQSLTAGDWLRASALAGLAIATPLVGAAALVRGLRVPGFADLIGPPSLKQKGILVCALGALWLMLCIVAAHIALGLVFDPRYKDFPFAPLTAAVIPYVVLSFRRLERVGPRATAETVFAGLLAGCAVYVALNESFANWQAVWLAAVLAAMAVTLLRVRDAPGSG